MKRMPVKLTIPAATVQTAQEVFRTDDGSRLNSQGKSYEQRTFDETSKSLIDV